MSSKLHKIVDTNKRCKHIKREGESCRLNNNCTYPDCKIETFNTKREMREILLEMYEKLWEADKDKFAWNVILKDTLEKLETFNINEK